MPTSESLEAAQSGVNFVWSNTDVVTPSPLQWETVIARSVYKNRHPLVAVMLLVSGPLTYLTFVGKYFYSNVGSSISVLSFTSVKEWQFFYDVHGLLAVVTKSVVWFSINVASSPSLIGAFCHGELSPVRHPTICSRFTRVQCTPRTYICVCVCVCILYVGQLETSSRHTSSPSIVARHSPSAFHTAKQSRRHKFEDLDCFRLVLPRI